MFTPLEMSNLNGVHGNALGRMKRKKRFLSLTGFTITELVITLLIVAILAIIVAPRFLGYFEIMLNNAASKIASDIAYAQQLAITTQRVHGVRFHPERNLYFLYVDNPSNKIEDSLRPGQELIVNFNEGPYRGVFLTEVDFNGKKEVEFDALGVPYSSVNPFKPLTGGGRVVISSNGGSRTISVSPNTGKVSIVE